MQIKRLRLSGFKSFVDAADLRIEPGLTGIVGPNGCGKSNLLEALRWTMGETSARSLRGAGMDDVIFAGTNTRPARDFAEVSMLIESAGEESEVVRRIERGAGSAYRIDGRDVRAKDVALLFADSATGAHSPALVSQGRIGAIIAAKPAERRAMLEEAAGIAGLHVRRKDAEQKLRATEANLARLDELIADQDGRANALRRQARQAERYRALSEQIRVAEARMIFARWRDAQQAADAAKAEAATCEARVAEASEAQRAAAAYALAATEALADARAQAQALREAASEAGHKLGGLRGEQAAAVRRTQELAAARVRLAEDRAREGSLASDAAEAIARLAEESKALEARLAEATARIPELETRLSEAERAGRDAEVALAQALAAQATELADARVAEAALAAARVRAERSARDLTRVTAESAALGDAAPLIAERAAAAAARAQAVQHGEDARAALTRADAEERGAREQRDRAQAARATAHADLAALDSEATALTKATRREGRERLLDRLQPEAGYERALAAALGDDLEAGLDPAGERFWAGAEVAPGDPAAPEGTVPLGQHVLAPAALARRLAQVFVAESDAGGPLAVGQRLVTLAGVLRRWDGYVAKSGGAAAAERLERMNRLRAIEAARPAAVRAVEAADGELARIDAAIAEARAGAVAARRLLESAETRARDAARAEDRAAAAIERIEAQRADLAARRQRIVADHEEAEAEVARAGAVQAALPDGSATRERVRALSGEAEARRTAIATARADRAGLDRDVGSGRERLAGTTAEAKSWRARAGEAARRIAEMDKRDGDLAAEAQALVGRPEALAAEIVALEAAHTAARAEADAAATAERAAEAALRAAEAQASAAAETLAQAREARAGAAARAENQEARRVEMNRLSGERFQCPSVLLPERVGFAGDTVRSPGEESATHEKLMVDRERIGPVNLVAESELAELEAASKGNAAEREELGLAVNRLRGSIGTLNREGRQRLMAAFEAVDGHFRRLFTTLFNGGQAHLELVDSDDPLEAGLEIMAQPPGKKLQSLTLLSGGEQALTAVALIFGLFLTNPAPICVLDEVDAPLDDANIERFCGLLDAMTRETQTRYLIVTHNAVTMSRMHRLFGVTMVEQGVSRLVSVDLGGAESLLAAE
ncbi:MULTISPECIES: chromosome segregation SMC family protein [unclassified Sphingomonas]|jgi:chromosome segregation protein|uniref:chromosome segregation SMC family protein n=1 Tax=unclassified Sphingomonas TaxID=196159 RepID=UPI0010F89439|nr:MULTISPECIES: AAA family ATPase [unclassified Sphingomonas]MDR6846889.1 chromosome segregation protein [Sphingomonas sp. BE137]